MHQRGSTTGISMMTRDVDWRSSHRVRLHHFANNQSDATTSFLVPNLGQDIEGDELDTGLLSATHETAPANEIANFYYDMSLAGGPLQCSDGDGTCGDLW
jgi:beta-1,2-xylosyltransferase